VFAVISINTTDKKVTWTVKMPHYQITQCTH